MHQMDWHQFLFWLAPLAGGALCALGCLAILAPALGGRAFGLPAHGPALPFVPALGARDVALGVALCGLCVHGEVRPVAILIFSLVVVALADAFVVWRYGYGRVVPVHAAGAVGALLYGAWLWLR